MSHPTRTALLDSALALFGERGYDGTSVPAIAQAAGVAVGTVYRHFEGKRDLLNALYCREAARLWDDALLGFDPDGEPRTEFDRLWTGLVGFASVNRTSFELLARRDHFRHLEPTTQGHERRLTTPLFEYFERNRAMGRTRNLEAGACVAMVRGALAGLVGAVPLTDGVSHEAGNAAWEMVASATVPHPRQSGVRARVPADLDERSMGSSRADHMEDWRVW